LQLLLCHTSPLPLLPQAHCPDWKWNLSLHVLRLKHWHYGLGLCSKISVSCNVSTHSD
jgi:hypothetical protein